jgi:ATP-dependent protease HslVU (ClpYQ) peptidase subunit
MTCIVSFFDNNKIVLAGDKCGSNGFTRSLVKEPKVFFIKDFMIGYTSSFRMGQILKYLWNPPERTVSQTTEKYLYSIVADSIRKTFKDHGFVAKSSMDEEIFGDFVICYDNRIFVMYSDLSILEHDQDIVCVGSGEYHAKVAIQILKEYESDFKIILDRAFKIVSTNVASVSPEFDYIVSK